MVVDMAHAALSLACDATGPDESRRAEFGLPWFAVMAVTLALSGTTVAVEGSVRVPDSVESQMSVHASMLAALLLAHSAVLYLTHAVVGWRALGRVASGLALAGGAGIVGASLVRFIEAEWLAPRGALNFAPHYEALTWFAALVVFAYLVIEDVYRTRVAGSVVMPAVAVAMGMAGWLMSAAPTTDTTFTALMERYVSGAWRCALLVATAALVVMGLVSLVRWLASAVAWRTRTDRSTGNAELLLYSALVVGVCALTLALLFDAARLLIPRWRAPSIESEAGLVMQWLILVAMFAAWRLGRLSGSLVAGGVVLALMLALAQFGGVWLGGVRLLELS